MTTDGLTRIDGNATQCRDCGQSLGVLPDDAELWIAESQDAPRADLPTDRQPRPASVSLCDGCRAAADRAMRLAPELGIEPIEALNAIHAAAISGIELGDTLAEWSSVAWWVHRAAAMIGYPGPPFRLRFSAWAGFGIGVAAAERWSWIPDDARSRLAAAVRGALTEAAQLAELPPTTRVSPPERACGVCGVSGVEVPTADVLRAGSEAKAAAEVFVRARGYRCCPMCAEAPGDRSGFVQAAAQIAAGVRGQVNAARKRAKDAGERPPRIPTVTAWSRANTAPAEEPWGWMDLEAFGIEVLAALTPAPERTPTLEELTERVRRLERIAGVR